MESASVVTLHKDTNKLRSYSITNTKGEYQILLDQGNNYNLRINYIGFKSISFDIDQTMFQKETMKNFILFEDIDQLDEVVLLYEIPIKVNNDTILYNTDSFVNGTEKN